MAQGGDLEALLEGIQAREQRRRTLQDELAGLEGLRSVTARELQDIQREVEGTDSRTGGDSYGARSPRAARSSGSSWSDGLSSGGRGAGVYEFSGQASLGRVLAGIVCTKAGVAPTGFEPALQP